MNPNSKILVALDTDTADKAVALARALQHEVGGFKVGLELVNAVGFDIFDKLHAEIGAAKIFYDCKFHDIPTTVAGACRAAAGRGVWMLNVHASGGSAMLRAAVQAAKEGAEAVNCAKPLVIAVTVLTSLDESILREEVGVGRTVAEQVVALARLAQDSGCDGVVASPQEIAVIRDACGAEFLIVTPGVRPAGGELGDQKRVMTPAEAVRAGADYLVVGRPLTAASDPIAAAHAINDEIGNIA